ncbi:hypothetical protein BH09BAC3_BH09BAC3_33930 [soil metagenome]
MEINPVQNKTTERYWLKKLTKVANSKPFLVNENNVVKGSGKKEIKRQLPPDIARSINELFHGENGRVQKFILFTTVLRLLHFKYTNLPDLVIVAGNLSSDIQVSNSEIVFFRNQLDDENSFVKLLANERNVVQEAEENSDFDLNRTLEKFSLNKLGDIDSLYRLGICYNQFSPYNRQLDRAGFLLSINEHDEHDGIVFSIIAQEGTDMVISGLFLDNYIHTLQLVLIDKLLPVRDLSCVTEREQSLINSFTSPLPPVGLGTMVIARFEKMVELHRDGIAVVHEGRSLTYDQLNDAANRMAHFLRKQLGVQSGDIVALHLDRTEMMAIATVAILKVGGVYLYVDPSYAPKRKQYILEDCHCKVLLSEKSYLNDIPTFWEKNYIDIAQASMNDTSNLDSVIHPDDAAFIIYTSGSTGKPKGVLQTHRCLMNVVLRQLDHAETERGLRILQFSSFSFDVFIAHELFFSLLSGGTLYIPSEQTRNDLRALGEYMIERKIEWFLLPITALNTIFEISEVLWNTANSIRHIVSAGEQLWLSDILLKFLRQNPAIKLHNFYGPSETHNAANNIFQIDRHPLEKHQPIGYPSINTEILILNSLMQQVPIGVKGELYIGGDGLAKGYVNQDALTKERFVRHPFKGTSLVYKTGDIGTWMSDGRIIYHGRNDDQLKIRGFRVEIGEIEMTLMHHQDIESAVVIVKAEGKESKKLIACYVAKAPIPSSELRAHLLDSLPDYMVPESFIRVDQMPVNNHGKVDRSALASYTNKDATRSEYYTAPGTELEKQLCEIWEEIVDHHPVGMVDNFFEIGGNSLKAIKLLYKIEKRFGVSIPLHACIHEFNVRKVSEIVQAGAGQGEFHLPEIDIDPKRQFESFPLSLIQQAYWLGRASAFDLGSIATQQYYEFKTKYLDVERFVNAFDKVVQKHPMMRMVVTDDGMQQVVPWTRPLDIPVIDAGEDRLDDSHTLIKNVRASMVDRPLNYKKQLFDLRITRLSENDSILHLCMDTLIADAWSTTILSKEIERFYNDPSLEIASPEVTYRDYILAEEEIKKISLYKISRDYWHERLATLPSAPQLPIARQPADIQRPTFKDYRFTLDVHSWTMVKAHCSSSEVTPTVLLITAFSEVLARWSGTLDFTINMTLFNRLPLHKDVNEIVGDFTSINLLEVNVDYQKSFRDRARNIQKRFWKDLEHRYYHGVEVLRELHRKLNNQSGGTMPIVFTSTIGFEESESTLADEIDPANTLEIETSFSQTQTSQVWLDHQVFESKGELSLVWTVLQEIFPTGMIDDMFASYCNLLKGLGQPDTWDNRVILFQPESQRDNIASVNATQHMWDETVIVRTIERMLQTVPSRIAICSPLYDIRYDELERHTNAIANWLVASGALPNKLVGIVMEKGWEQIVSVLGVLRAGAAYLPIDASWPKDRRDYLLEHAQVDIVLTQLTSNALPVPETIQHRLIVSKEDLSGRDTNFISRELNADDLAYVIFTSGSTGKPKGVMITHRQVTNTVADINRRFKITAADSVLGLSSLSFDLSVYDILGLFAVGGTVVVPTAKGSLDPNEWLSLIHRKAITVWNTVPALFELLISAAADNVNFSLDSLRLTMLSGDWIPLSLAARAKSRLREGAELISLGGATEVSIWSIYFPIERIASHWKSIPYGKPLANQVFYVLDSAFQPSPFWVPGELYIGGAGVANGYWQDRERTSASFILHPQTDEKIYRTGDLGRRLPDGNIEFLGRNDFQVKINGFRIELGEIESVLAHHPLVKDAIVSAQGATMASKTLAAYVIPKLASPINETVVLLESGALHHREKRIILGTGRDTPIIQRHSTILTMNDLLTILSCLLPTKMPGVDLPKFLYPSPGSDYFVGLYCCLAPNVIDNQSGQLYHFHPDSAKLMRVGTENISGFFNSSTLSLFLVADMDKLSANHFYGSTEFRYLESGYMIRLLNATANALGFNFSISSHWSQEDVGKAFQLTDRQLPVCCLTLDSPGGLVADIASLEKASMSQAATLSGNGKTRSDSISLFNTHFLTDDYRRYQSFKEFEEGVINAENIAMFFKALRVAIPADSTLGAIQFFVITQPNRIDGIASGVYHYEPLSHSLALIRGLEQEVLLFEGFNNIIFQEAALALFISSTGDTPILSDSLLLAGHVGQQLREQASASLVGVCPVAKWSEEIVRGYLGLQPHEHIVHGVIAGKISGDKFLTYQAAEYSPENHFISLIKKFLYERVPKHMHPSAYKIMEAFPLGSNGKIDRNALPAMKEVSRVGTTMSRLPNDVERKVAEIWAKELDVEVVAIDDDFFQLGGHSLTAIKVIYQLKMILSVNLELGDIIQHPTVAALSELIGKQARIDYKTIQPLPLSPFYELSSAQTRLWILNQFGEIGHAYNISMAYSMEGDIRHDLLQQALKSVINRHENLRTQFQMVDGVPKQVVRQDVGDNFKISYFDLRNVSDKELYSKEILDREMKHPFDLENAPLVRASILQLSERGTIFLFTIHHIIADQWSLWIIFNELLTFYNAQLTSRPATLKELRVHYKDYSAWQNQRLEGEQSRIHQLYWLNQFEGELPTLALPADNVRPVVMRYEGSNYRQTLDPAIMDGIRQESSDREATIFMTLMASINVLLYKYTGQHDFILGFPSAGRDHLDLEEQVGYYVNTLALRTRVFSDETFDDLLQRVKVSVLGAFRHEVYPFERLVDDLKLERNTSRPPLFSILVVMRNKIFPMRSVVVDGVSVRTYSLANETSKFDITLTFIETGDRELVLDVEYNSNLFSQKFIEEFAGHYHTLLGNISKQFTTTIGSLLIVSPEENINLILQGISLPLTAENNRLHELIEFQARIHPELIAVECGLSEITYGDLNERANKVARALIKAGAKQNELIGLMMERSEWQIIAMLGILKAGAGYVPIDPEYPEVRKDYIIHDCNLSLVLTDRENDLTWRKVVSVAVRSHWDVIDTYSGEDLNIVITQETVAYVIYTSGSTGNPKGVLITHGNVTGLLTSIRDKFQFTSSDVWTLFHSVNFDFSVWEIFGSLCTGGRLIVVLTDIAKSVKDFSKLIVERGVTVLNQVPGMFYLVADELSRMQRPLALQHIIFGGEALNPGRLRGWRMTFPEVVLVNMYGITETTVHVTYKLINDNDIFSGVSNIGQALTGMSVLLVDADLHPVPDGVIGQMVIGGYGLSKGYLNKPDLTEERFIKNIHYTGGRLYLSGDLGIKLPNGDIRYMGRADQQLKIRGHRIESGEIESQLLRLQGVRECVVLVKQDREKNNQLLICYSADTEMDAKTISGYLEKVIPSYMIPSEFLQVDVLPRTLTGKVDKSNLLKMSMAQVAAKAVIQPPVTDTEKKLAGVWAEILGNDSIGIDENFFLIGGHSLRAVRMIYHIEQLFAIKLELKKIFASPTIRLLSTEIDNILWARTTTPSEGNSNREEITLE